MVFVGSRRQDKSGLLLSFQVLELLPLRSLFCAGTTVCQAHALAPSCMHSCLHEPESLLYCRLMSDTYLLPCLAL